MMREYQSKRTKLNSKLASNGRRPVYSSMASWYFFCESPHDRQISRCKSNCLRGLHFSPKPAGGADETILVSHPDMIFKINRVSYIRWVLPNAEAFTKGQLIWPKITRAKKQNITTIEVNRRTELHCGKSPSSFPSIAGLIQDKQQPSALSQHYQKKNNNNKKDVLLLNQKKKRKRENKFKKTPVSFLFYF